jgi:hypothetical protein
LTIPEIAQLRDLASQLHERGIHIETTRQDPVLMVPV